MASSPWLHRLGDAVRKVQRNLPHPVVGRWRDLPPIPADPAAGRRLAVLFHGVFYREALWCAWSWLRRLGPGWGVTFGVDGEPLPGALDGIARLLPGAEVVRSEAFLPPFRALGPVHAAFADRQRYGRKVAFLYGQQARGDVLFSDFDIVCFRRPDALLAEIAAGRELVHITDDNLLQAPAVRARARELGIVPPPLFNSGLLFLRRGVLDPVLMGRVLEGLHGDWSDWMIEQDTLGALAGTRDAVALPAGAYTTDFGAQFFWQRELDYVGVVARHYAGPVRHLLYLKGLPYLLRQARREARA